MPNFLAITPPPLEYLEKMGLDWHTDADAPYIIRDQLLLLRKDEIDAYKEAANSLYTMYEKAAEYVIKENLFAALDIPESLICPIKESFKNERSNHLYGRFDLAGGIDNKPIKLIEFNADTATLLVESAVIEPLILAFNKLKTSDDANTIYRAISKKFQKIAAGDKAHFSKFLFSSIKDVAEEINTTKLLESMAKDAGAITHFSHLEDIGFLEDQIVDEHEQPYDFWFKLYPWEEMLDPEKHLKTAILNPAYTLLYQSKGILAVLYELFPDSPYLLEASFNPLKNKKYVKKRAFGREGANIDIVDSNGVCLLATEGIYTEYKSVYQEYVDFVRDDAGYYYQAGVFYSDGACGVGFRRGAEILDDRSQFIPSFVRD